MSVLPSGILARDLGVAIRAKFNLPEDDMVFVADKETLAALPGRSWVLPGDAVCVWRLPPGSLPPTGGCRSHLLPLNATPPPPPQRQIQSHALVPNHGQFLEERLGFHLFHECETDGDSATLGAGKVNKAWVSSKPVVGCAWWKPAMSQNPPVPTAPVVAIVTRSGSVGGVSIPSCKWSRAYAIQPGETGDIEIATVAVAALCDVPCSSCTITSPLPLVVHVVNSKLSASFVASRAVIRAHLVSQSSIGPVQRAVNHSRLRQLRNGGNHSCDLLPSICTVINDDDDDAADDVNPCQDAAMPLASTFPECFPG